MKREFSLAMRSLLFIAIAVAAWLIGIVIGQENAIIILNPNASTATIREVGKPNISAMLDYNNGDIDVIDNIELSSHANLWEVLLDVEKQGRIKLDENEDWPKVGLQWYGINGMYNTGDARWYLWLNNEYVSELPDNIVVKNGDVLYFKYLSYFPR